MNTNLKMLIGVIIGILLLFILPNMMGSMFITGSMFAIILATIYVGYTVGENWRNGAFNGAIVGIILAIIYFIGAYYFSGTLTGFSPSILVLTLLFIIITFGIFGVVGGSVGIFIKGKITSTKSTDESTDYLICNKCGGYYELKEGESLEDYEGCECGGQLKYSPSILTGNESEDYISDKSSINNEKDKLSFINFRNKKFLLIISILALIIMMPILYSVITNPNYTLLGSYNASKINMTGTNVTIPNGTKSIKIEYNLQAQETNENAIGLGVVAYNQNNIPSYGNATSLVTGQNKKGTMIINTEMMRNFEIVHILLQEKGIQGGNIKIYTAK
jgi:Family of unknown function (DUF5518)